MKGTTRKMRKQNMKLKKEKNKKQIEIKETSKRNKDCVRKSVGKRMERERTLIQEREKEEKGCVVLQEKVRELNGSVNEES